MANYGGQESRSPLAGQRRWDFKLQILPAGQVFHGINRLAEVQDKPARSKFKAYVIGYVHIDFAEVRTEEGKLQLFVAIDRTSKLACQFLRDLIEAFPYRLRTILTYNGVQFCHPPRHRDSKARKPSVRSYLCRVWDRTPRLIRP